MANIGRIFVGLEPPDTACIELIEALKPLGRLPGRVLPPENWHVTLRFVGMIDEVGYERMLAGLDQAERGGAFRIRLAGLGAFPNPRRATVLWIGVDHGVEQVNALARTVEGVAVDAGIEPEERPFHPHLTLARIRPQRDVSRLVQMGPAPVGWRVEHLTVYRSNLDANGARYEVLERLEL